MSSFWDTPGVTDDKVFETNQEGTYSKYDVRNIIAVALSSKDNKDELVDVVDFLVDKLENIVLDSKDVFFCTWARENLLVDLITADTTSKEYVPLVLLVDRLDALLKY